MAGNPPDANGKLLHRIDERTKLMDEKMDSHHEKICGTLKDHEDRLRKLERNTWWRDGAAALTGAVTGLVAGLSSGK